MIMKTPFRILISALFAVAVLTGCEEDPVFPLAAFTYEPSEVTVYDQVTFTNESADATSYAWDFGDGNTSTEENPTHVYMSAGTYAVKLVATNADGDADVEITIVVNEPDNNYTLDGVVYSIDSEMFWYSVSMGGPTVTYIRLITAVPGQENPDLLKLYPNMGINELPGTYTFDNDEAPVGTYDVGYTSGYAGFNYDWTAIGKTGSGDLVITELETGVYKFEGTMVLSVGSYDYETGEFTETSTKNLTLDYIGGVTPL